MTARDIARDSPGGSDGKESACNEGDQVPSLGREDPLEKGMATQSSILAWRIPWTEEPGGLQTMDSQRVRHNWKENKKARDYDIKKNPLTKSTFLTSP